MNLRLLSLAPLALLAACSLLPFGKSKPAPATADADAAQASDSAGGIDYLPRPNDDNRKALADLHAALKALKDDPNLGYRAPDQMKQADLAVAEADKLQARADHAPEFIDVVTGDAQKCQVDVRPLAHLIYLADRRVQIARALAEASWYEDEAKDLRAQRDAQQPKRQ